MKNITRPVLVVAELPSNYWIVMKRSSQSLVFLIY